LKEKIGIDEKDLNVLSPFADFFIARKDEFADYFYDVFFRIPEARVVLESESEPGLLKKVWAAWFDSLFRSRLDGKFLAYLWSIGARHVEVNLDHRFTNLGFSIIRQFCHKVIQEETGIAYSATLVFVFDKLLDLCLLIETDAFIEKTTRCDLQVFQGVEDRVRNPALVIGGNIKRLQKQVAAGSKEYKVYEMLMAENQRLERMVSDVKAYMEIFNEVVNFQPLRVDSVIAPPLSELRAEALFNHVKVETECGGDTMKIMGDPGELKRLFYALLRNGMEAVDPENPLLKITARKEKAAPFNVEIEIFNRGIPPKQEEIEDLFTPFYSTKLAGTGFGLPMAKLIVRKHYGKIRMEPMATGTKVIITLPAGPSSAGSSSSPALR
jgi:signal transduction histidine kinase